MYPPVNGSANDTAAIARGFNELKAGERGWGPLLLSAGAAAAFASEFGRKMNRSKDGNDGALTLLVDPEEDKWADVAVGAPPSSIMRYAFHLKLLLAQAGLRVGAVRARSCMTLNTFAAQMFYQPDTDLALEYPVYNCFFCTRFLSGTVVLPQQPPR